MFSGPSLEKPFDIASLLRCGLETKADEAALVSEEKRWTWRELDQAGERIAGHLLALGLKPGDRVASLMPNRTELLMHYIACQKAGLVATPLNYRYQAPEIDHALEVSGASVLLAHVEREEDLKASRRAGQLPLGIIRYGGGQGQGPHFEDFIASEAPPMERPPLDSSLPAIIFFTSGSTGLPKGVTHSRETLGWLIASAMGGLEARSGNVFMPGSSISHIGGYLLSMAGLAAGARVVVARTFDGDELLPRLREDRPSVLLMLPAALFALVRDHEAKRRDFDSLRICMSGGDKVSAELEEEFNELTGFKIEECYGMTEIGFTTMNPPSGVNKLGSVGTLFPGYVSSIRDETGREVNPNQEGRLWIKFGGNMVGYWNNPEATAATLKDGWLDTGDIMRMDEDGYLWFCGRKKQIIVHDGSNICPQEVEEALLAHPSVESAGVVGIHNLLHGENVRAYITLKPGATPPTCQDLIRFARERVGYKAPEEIVVLDEMPLNATGKTDRVTLKQMAASGSSVPCTVR